MVRWRFLGLESQTVDSNGDKTSFTADVFKAIKPQEVDTLHRYDFNGKSQANLRYTFAATEM